MTVNVDPYSVPELAAAKALFDGLSGQGYDIISKDELLFDDNWSVPLKY